MIVDHAGRAYIGEFGYDYAAGAERAAARLITVSADGEVQVAAEDVWFPNGMQLTAGGAQLLLAETPQSRVTSFEVASDEC